MVKSSEFLTVSELTDYIKRKFTVDPYLRRVYVTGQLYNFRLRRGHQYFSIKDEQAVINVAMFAPQFAKVQFKPQDGMKVLITGRVDVYKPRGNYQLIAESMEPDGLGALYLRFKQMVKKLKGEGLFDLPKKPLPLVPKRIAVITSPSGAVIRDIITTARRRDPKVQIILFPSAVQGDDAAAQLVHQIEAVNQIGNFDDLIIGRGGGSLEDLWPFNEESVARAIAASQVPVVSSVGHETDTTIADLVADRRVATPTAAAEVTTPVLTDLLTQLANEKNRLVQVMNGQLRLSQQHLNELTQSYIFQSPERLYQGYEQNLSNLTTKMTAAFQGQLHKLSQHLSQQKMALAHQSPEQRLVQAQHHLKEQTMTLQQLANNRLQSDRQALTTMIKELDSLSPLKVMTRGYSYVSRDEHVISSAEQLKNGDTVKLHFHDGIAQAQIQQTRVEEHKNGND
ncbi:exodeoxyribonuclease VII large subunit [Limosilactobacillus sp.]|uniref:exodeoxyribonuclease VII large subunit n=1 Tax=Limosilactobacillus sp. TaxID=2773925 RepID=UPI00345E0726